MTAEAIAALTLVAVLGAACLWATLDRPRYPREGIAPVYPPLIKTPQGSPSLAIGDRVRHPERGAGTIFSGCPDGIRAWVQFDDAQPPDGLVIVGVTAHLGRIELAAIADLSPIWTGRA